ncbi:unnamed protein product [Trichobilharzia regenti]|nr:unnamed protein product [Trichobilharzia regenti]
MSFLAALSKVDKTTAEQVRAQCGSTLKHQKKERSNLSRISLSNDKNILIAKLDKGHTTIVVDKSDYINKVNQHIETLLYEEFKKPMGTITNKWFNLVPKTNNPIRMHSAKETDKAGYPTGSIVDFSNTPTNKLL